MLNASDAPLALALPLTVVALDLVSYGWHRANHRIAVLWRFHRVHHSDTAFTLSTGLRFHPGELLLSLPLRLAAIGLLGAPVAAVLAFEVAFTLSNLIEHSDANCPTVIEPGLSRLLVTPALHRLHHARHRPELDSNFATIFSVWDQLFGTYRESDSARQVRTGVPGLRGPLSLGGTLGLPFR